MIAYAPLLVAIVGLLLYALSSKNAKVAEIGRILFFCGVLTLTLGMAGETVRLLR